MNSIKTCVAAAAAVAISYCSAVWGAEPGGCSTELSSDTALKRSYEALAKQDDFVAVECAGKALSIAGIDGPYDEKKTQLLLYFARLTSTVDTGQNEAGNKAIGLLIDTAQKRQDMAIEYRLAILLEAAQLANAKSAYQVALKASTLAERMAKSEASKISKLDDEIIAESLYAMQSHIVLGKEGGSRLHEPWQKDNRRKHADLQSRVCLKNTFLCRFYETRWQIGECIDKSIVYGPGCLMDVAGDVTNVGKICNDLSVEQCHELQIRLQPYYLELFKRGGAPK
jgi:hypothetical protein